MKSCHDCFLLHSESKRLWYFIWRDITGLSHQQARHVKWRPLHCPPLWVVTSIQADVIVTSMSPFLTISLRDTWGLFFLYSLHSSNFGGHEKQLMGISKVMITVQPKSHWLFPPSAHEECQVSVRASEGGFGVHRRTWSGVIAASLCPLVSTGSCLVLLAPSSLVSYRPWKLPNAKAELCTAFRWKNPSHSCRYCECLCE